AQQTEEGRKNIAAKAIVQIGYARRCIVPQFFIEPVKASKAFMTSLRLENEKPEAFHCLAESVNGFTTNHDDFKFGVCIQQLANDGHRHGYVAHGRKAKHK